MMIDGVKVKPLRVVPNEQGCLVELLRADDEIYIKFGQLNLNALYPKVVQAWHYHLKQWSHFLVIRGMVKLVLYDGREDSPTRGQLQEWFIGDWNQKLVQVPPGVYYGLMCLSQTEALVISVTTEPYNYDDPDEFHLDRQTGAISYVWNQAE